MTITIYLQRIDLKSDLQSIHIICRDSDLIMNSNNALENYKRLYKLKGNLYSENKPNTLQLNVSLSDYATLCYFLNEQI